MTDIEEIRFRMNVEMKMNEIIVLLQKMLGELERMKIETS